MRNKERKEKDWTTVSIKRDTVEQLNEVGKKSETYDDVIKRLIKEHTERILNETM